mmetsp:Transcript_38682/g.62336  ORF Transcript_38682/g.62336 Transcript_38682/m.62336 type:complete len:201 (-) Transcript_38682:775-1377(-)
MGEELKVGAGLDDWSSRLRVISIDCRGVISIGSELFACQIYTGEAGAGVWESISKSVGMSWSISNGAVRKGPVYFGAWTLQKFVIFFAFFVSALVFKRPRNMTIRSVHFRQIHRFMTVDRVCHRAIAAGGGRVFTLTLAVWLSCVCIVSSHQATCALSVVQCANVAQLLGFTFDPVLDVADNMTKGCACYERGANARACR